MEEQHAQIHCRPTCSSKEGPDQVSQKPVLTLDHIHNVQELKRGRSVEGLITARLQFRLCVQLLRNKPTCRL